VKAILNFLRGSDEPTRSQIDKAVKQVTQPYGEAGVRMAAAERLRAWGTPEAIAGLLRRFTIQTPSGGVDLEESQQVEAMLVELGPRAVDPILRHLEREEIVAYPARALEKILPREEFVARILGVLERLEAGFGSHNEQRVGLIRALGDIDDPGIADPRVAPAIRRFLSDPNDDVAIAAIACLVRAGDISHRDDLVDLLVKTGDRPRVRREVAERLAELGWPLEASRRLVDANLPEGFSIDKKGRVVAH
jgi:HEAT repeat protein